MKQALLPVGMSDVLAPDAAFEAYAVESIMEHFAAYGYERLKPPLLEFEGNLLRGPGQAVAAQTFRLLDPASGRMMGLRADMTPQIARIATSRLSQKPRPLRLSYAGQVLRVSGTQIRPARQFGQIGAEIIGVNSPAADAELIIMSVKALGTLGIGALSADICLPTMMQAICRDLQLDTALYQPLQQAMQRKDAAGLATALHRVPEVHHPLFTTLLEAVGPLERGLALLQAQPYGPQAHQECEALAAIAARLNERAPDLTLTLDPAENRGWEYHAGLSFSILSRTARGELGAGGRYDTSDDGVSGTEQACGLTLFTDMLLSTMPRPDARQRVYFPANAPHHHANALRDDGWYVVEALCSDNRKVVDLARMAGCSHYWDGKAVHAL